MRKTHFSQLKEWKRLARKINILAERKDYRGMATAHYEAAEFLEARGDEADSVRDAGYRTMLRLRLRDLRIMRKFDPLLKLKILTAGDSCMECKKFDSVTLSIQEARSSKILPSKECTGKHGCRCVYAPQFESRHLGEWTDAIHGLAQNG